MWQYSEWELGYSAALQVIEEYASKLRPEDTTKPEHWKSANDGRNLLNAAIQYAREEFENRDE